MRDFLKNSVNAMIFALIGASFCQPAMAEVKVNLAVDYVEVEADSPVNFLSQLNILKSDKPLDIWSEIDWRFIQEVNFVSTAQGCKLNNFDTEVDMTLILPVWVNIAQQNEQDQQWWQRFNRYVTEHEQAHKEHLIEGIKQAAEEYQAIGEQASCSLVRNAYFAIKEKYESKINKLDAALDSRDGGDVCLEYLMQGKLQEAL